MELPSGDEALVSPWSGSEHATKEEEEEEEKEEEEVEEAARAKRDAGRDGEQAGAATLAACLPILLNGFGASKLHL